MKYMGSKRSMLKNGLGKLLLRETKRFDRFVDLFTGAAFVAWFVAENLDKPVLAVDLQKYATSLAQAVIGRTSQLDSSEIISSWIEKSAQHRNSDSFWLEAVAHFNSLVDIQEWVSRARDLCSIPSGIGPIWSAYGGHYFSPAQAITFDYLIANLPKESSKREVCLAACISAASECVAAPGHTAQPFQPTNSAAQFIVEAWKRDPIEYSKKNLIALATRHAQVLGSTITDDAANVIPHINSTDLVFIDPPYSSVQYSRFYHVLETIARVEQSINVSGVGRYPPLDDRPQSQFSNISQAKPALIELLKNLAERSCTIILTFPSGPASNSLSGDYIKQVASQWFTVEDHSTISGKFSTLGGNNEIRDARMNSNELILLMKPR